jgi:predicted phosphodiesterase
MIYLASDMHGKKKEDLIEYERIAKPDDLLIILGDLGIGFEKTEENREFTDFFFSLKSNIAIVDGNHENFPLIESFPVEDWQGGQVHRLSPNIVHLMRGNIFEIEGKSIFVMGGCKSSAKWKDMGLYFEREEQSREEFLLAYKNLEKYGNKVDYIFTHKYTDKYDTGADKYSFDGLLNYLNTKVEYRKWISGHWHEYIEFDPKHFCLYDLMAYEL